MVRRSQRTTFVALLRGINVGRAKQVAMDELRALVEAEGYEGVQTLLRSGNLIFTGPAAQPRRVAEKLERAIESGLGVKVGVVVRTADELAAVIAANPIRDAAGEGSNLHVMFLADPLPAAERKRLAADDFEPDVVRPVDHEIYVWYRKGMSGSTTATQLGRRVKTLATDRNWNTVDKLAQLARTSSRPPAG